MTKFFISVFLLMFFTSCNNSNRNDKESNKFHYEYNQLKKGLLRIVEFFPDSNDTSIIYFLDIEKKKVINSYNYDTEGNKIEELIYYDDPDIKTYRAFYKNGNVKNEYTLKGKFLNGYKKTFYENGRIQLINEYILYKDTVSYYNSSRYYNKNGEINYDSSFYAELLTTKDTISVNETLKFELSVIVPNDHVITAYFGTIDEYLFTNIFYEVDRIKSRVFSYKPKHIGVNNIQIVVLFIKKDTDKYLKSFIKKEIYVTD